MSQEFVPKVYLIAKRTLILSNLIYKRGGRGISLKRKKREVGGGVEGEIISLEKTDLKRLKGWGGGERAMSI